MAFGRKFGQFRNELAGFVEQFLGVITSQPVFEDFEMSGIGEVVDGDLVGAEGALDGEAVNLFGTGPAFGTSQDNERPRRATLEAFFARVFLNRWICSRTVSRVAAMS